MNVYHLDANTYGYGIYGVCARSVNVARELLRSRLEADGFDEAAHAATAAKVTFESPAGRSGIGTPGTVLRYK